MSSLRRGRRLRPASAGRTDRPADTPARDQPAGKPAAHPASPGAPGGPAVPQDATSAPNPDTQRPARGDAEVSRAFRRGLGYLLVVALAAAVLTVASQLLLVVVAAFTALGLEPVVLWLQRRGVPRRRAVTLIVLTALAALSAFLAAAIPTLVDQGSQLLRGGPDYLDQLQTQHTGLGRLAQKLHLSQRLQQLSSDQLGSGGINGVLDLGRTALSYAFQLLVVVVITIYILADLPHITGAMYRLAPVPLRPRLAELGDQFIVRTGGYLLGNLLTSLVATLSQYLELRLLDVPFALLLAVLVGVFDLVPLIGSIIAGVVVVTVALTLVSPTAAIITLVFILAYRVFEDYLLSPRILRRTVEVPALVTIVAVLLGGALLGIEGGLIAVPVAAGVQLLVTEVVYPRTDPPP